MLRTHHKLVHRIITSHVLCQFYYAKFLKILKATVLKYVLVKGEVLCNNRPYSVSNTYEVHSIFRVLYPSAFSVNKVHTHYNIKSCYEVIDNE